jgi:hypothetical protein
MQFGANIQNPTGLNRVELWVNGTIRKTCSGNTQDCAFTINGSDYSANANVAFNARAIDGNGTETWTTLRNLYVSDSGTNTGGTTYGATGFYTLLVPGSQWMQFGANIQNPINLNRVELPTGVRTHASRQAPASAGLGRIKS